MRINGTLFRYAVLLTLVGAGCATPVPRFKADSDEQFIRLRSGEAATLFPAEFRDIYLTLHRGDDLLSQENVDSADRYYQLAIGKIELLRKQYVVEMKRREDAARLESERLERAAAEELRHKQELARAQAAETARVQALARKAEAERAEARRRLERARVEKEITLAATHTVKRGETLPQIAALAEVYGDSALWPLLYRANRDQISNPAVLWPGQVLRIPRNYDKADLSEARRFSSDRHLR